MNIMELYRICESKEDFLSSLRNWGLIPNEVKCRNCEKPMKLFNRANSADGYEYACKNKISRNKKKRACCDTRLSLRTGTFFEGSKLSIWQILAFVNLWVLNARLQLISVQIKLSSSSSSVNWASYCREVLLQTFCKKPIKIGGLGKTVEIDEIKFGEIKTCRGHPIEGNRVFGGIERGAGRIFLVYVDIRDKDTLLALIKTWIEDGTTIVSDCCKAYDCLESEELRQLEVNHSIQIKDSENGTQTRAIECSLRHVKNALHSPGRKEAHIPGNLARYMFCKKCDELKLDRTIEFFRLAGLLYNPNEPQENAGNRNPDLFNMDMEFDDENFLDEYFLDQDFLK